MRRILVMGCSGAGKTTFARALASRLGAPLVSLDQLFWQPGWREPARADFSAKVIAEAEQPAWVMDGDYIRYGGDLRRARADTIVWFDLPTLTCLTSVLRRIAKTYRRVRPEMAPGCPERLDWAFLRYVCTYRKTQRPRLLAYFAGLSRDQRLVVFTSRADATKFLSGLETA